MKAAPGLPRSPAKATPLLQTCQTIICTIAFLPACRAGHAANLEPNCASDDPPFERNLSNLVRARLASRVPEDIGEYWVEIDDVRWPVSE